MPNTKISFSALALFSTLSTPSIAEPLQSTFITTSVPTRLLSVNDGEAGPLLSNRGTAVKDSITVIDLSPQSAPRIRTVYETGLATLIGSPHTAIVGHYGVVTNHSLRLDQEMALVDVEATSAGSNQVTVIDMRSLEITQQLALDSSPWLSKSHPDGKRVILAMADGWLVARINNQGSLDEMVRTSFPHSIYSFDISTNGEDIIAALQSDSGERWLAKFIVDAKSQVQFQKRIDEGNFLVDGPFSPRITPDGQSAIALNSWGISDGVLDDALIINMDSGRIIERIAQVGDGLESVAIHPSGDFAVISCLDAMPWSVTSHLAVVSLTGPSAQHLYSLPVEALPEGIEFSRDGEQLFLGSTVANHISVYAVDGMRLTRSPFVLPTGDGHSALAINYD